MAKDKKKQQNDTDDMASDKEIREYGCSLQILGIYIGDVHAEMLNATIRDDSQEYCALLENAGKCFGKLSEIYNEAQDSLGSKDEFNQIASKEDINEVDLWAMMHYPDTVEALGKQVVDLDKEWKALEKKKIKHYVDKTKQLKKNLKHFTGRPFSAPA